MENLKFDFMTVLAIVEFLVIGIGFSLLGLQLKKERQRTKSEKENNDKNKADYEKSAKDMELKHETLSQKLEKQLTQFILDIKLSIDKMIDKINQINITNTEHNQEIKAVKSEMKELLTDYKDHKKTNERKFDEIEDKISVIAKELHDRINEMLKNSGRK